MYNRIILKLSGEALSGDNGIGFDDKTAEKTVLQIKKLIENGIQTALVVGGGNWWRGRSSDSKMDRTKADSIGMLATVMNGIYLADCFRQQGVKARVMTPITVGNMTELFSKEKAVEALEAGEIIIFAAGIGHPFFSTDTVTALRAAELDADCILYAKSIDGVYTADPATDPTAVKLDELPCAEIVEKNLKVIDIAAANLCCERKIPLVIFAMAEDGAILKAAKGEKIGTTVTV
ncbi:MAG: UMP kinase [Clostridiales bacterium]|nr:UMP kinase [Clostridiales bacterium]